MVKYRRVILETRLRRLGLPVDGLGGIRPRLRSRGLCLRGGDRVSDGRLDRKATKSGGGGIGGRDWGVFQSV